MHAMPCIVPAVPCLMPAMPCGPISHFIIGAATHTVRLINDWWDHKRLIIAHGSPYYTAKGVIHITLIAGHKWLFNCIYIR